MIPVGNTKKQFQWSNLAKSTLLSGRAGGQIQVQSLPAKTHAAKTRPTLLEVVLFLVIAFCLIVKESSKRERVVSFFFFFIKNNWWKFLINVKLNIYQCVEACRNSLNRFPYQWQNGTEKSNEHKLNVTLLPVGFI